jgi:hypothetical protein
MTWSGKAGFGAAGFCLAVLLCFEWKVGVLHGTKWIWPTARAALIVGGLTWVICRILDSAFDGPQRRRRI